MADELKGLTALITGASSGIGRSTARLLGRAGADLFLTARREENLKSLQAEILEYGVRAVILPMDLALEEAPEKIISACTQAFGRLDILINNAGQAVQRAVADTDTELWDKLFALNARAPFLLCKYALPYLKQSPAATVIQIGSCVGINAYENQSAYAASKHALRGFTQSFAKEVFSDGIRVHMLSLGGVDTDLISDVRPDLDRSILSKPEEVAEVALFLLTHRNNSAIDEVILRRYSKKPWA